MEGVTRLVIPHFQCPPSHGSYHVVGIVWDFIITGRERAV